MEVGRVGMLYQCKQGLKKILMKNRMFYCKIYYLLGHNRITGKNRNRIIHNVALLKNCKIVIEGENNEICIESNAVMNAVTFSIRGNHNKIHVYNDVSMSEGGFYIEDDRNTIEVGKGTTLSGKVQMSCTEGTHINIGNDCMLSANIEIRTSDAHSIVDLGGVRINPSRDIVIGDHCWIGNTVIILKGTKILSNSIVGAGSVVTKTFDEEGIMIAGNPAKIIKKNVGWRRERI